ncbi:MAG: hypothetical protein ACJAZC_002829, partial [Cryomorphaceae bacterium]
YREVTLSTISKTIKGPFDVKLILLEFPAKDMLICSMVIDKAFH